MLKTHVEDGLEIPDHLGSEVTFDQKKRLARLAKMGIGPVAKPLGRASAQPAPASDDAGAAARQEDRAPPEERERRIRQQLQERRAAMLEHERRLRAQEEVRRQEEERELREREDQKKKKSRAGLSSLGAVMPREAVPQPARPAYPAPAPAVAGAFEEVETAAPAALRRVAAAASGAASPLAPAAVGGAVARLEVKISSETAERVGGASSSAAGGASGEAARRFREGAAEAAAAASAGDAENGEDGEVSAEAQVLAALRAKRSATGAASTTEEERRRKKKRRKKAAKRDDEKERPDSEDSYEVEEEEPHVERPNAHALKQARDGGISWKMMNVESVKGKVSNDNKHMTDADLERRFGSREAAEPASGMMTEEQVLAMMQKERKGQRDTQSSARRAKKELAEWTQLKAQKMARTGPDDKERLVVSRR